MVVISLGLWTQIAPFCGAAGIGNLNNGGSNGACREERVAADLHRDPAETLRRPEPHSARSSCRRPTAPLQKITDQIPAARSIPSLINDFCKQTGIELYLG